MLCAKFRLESIKCKCSCCFNLLTIMLKFKLCTVQWFIVKIPKRLSPHPQSKPKASFMLMSLYVDVPLGKKEGQCKEEILKQVHFQHLFKFQVKQNQLKFLVLTFQFQHINKIFSRLESCSNDLR